MSVFRGILLSGVMLMMTQLMAAPAALQDYQKEGQLAPLPAGTASLYRTPWRSNVHTVAAYDALQGVGVYYKHIPGNWTVEQHTAVMQQMVAAGVKRLRIAPHYAMYLHKDWTGFTPEENADLTNTLKACKATGIRPCIIFVHVPAMGKGDEIQKWFTRTWNKGLMPTGEPGSPEEKLFFDKTYQAFKGILDIARATGFTEPGSYDLEMGQNIWWGFPALPPFPGLKWEMLQPGGQVYEFEKQLLEQAQKDGYQEPVVRWGQSYHYFEQMSDKEVPPGVTGRAISFYSPYAGIVGENWTGADPWPDRAPLKFAEGIPQKMVLAKPEGFMADFSRHDNLHQLLQSSKLPVAITSLGVVPGDIPDAKSHGLSGWDLKSRGLTRSLAFWLNQGAQFVLLHSAYEGENGEMSHALIPYLPDPKAFKLEQSQPLTTMKNFTEVLAGAKKLDKVEELHFKYALDKDYVLIPGVGKTAPLMASDAVALLTYQISESKFAIAAYIVTPNIAIPLQPTNIILQIDRSVQGEVRTIHPSDGTQAKIPYRGAWGTTTVQFPVRDDVTWVVIDVKK